MNPASAPTIHELRPVLIEKRARLEAAARSIPEDYLRDLLDEVDSALRKIDDGAFGLCETCHDPIEPERLACNPLERFCLDHLDAAQRKAHEEDLELATRIQSTLLPPAAIDAGAWRAHYRYQPAGIVGGDYCEIVPAGGALFFALGDVTGKGVAASLLMTHLSAIFRSLLTLDLPLAELVLRANRLFCESTPATHYATLVAGRATESGLDLCNAGHCRPMLLRRDAVETLDSDALPIGLFCDGRYPVTRLALDPGDTLVLYSDGLTEAQDPAGSAYDEDRLAGALLRHAQAPVETLADAVLEDVARFRRPAPQQDDVTLLLLRRA